MRKFIDFSARDFGNFFWQIVLWLAAYKSADVFNFFETYSSLWFLPAGVTLSIALVALTRLLLAPLVANLLLAICACDVGAASDRQTWTKRTNGMSAHTQPSMAQGVGRWRAWLSVSTFV